MKLRKLLSGVTAAIMAISSVAVASFTSVSATSEFDAYSTVWYKGFYGVTDSIIAQGNATEEMAGATQAKIYFDLGPSVNQLNSLTILNTNYQIGFATDGKIAFKGSADWSSTDFEGVRTFTLDFKTTMEAGQGYKITGNTGSWTNCNSADNYVFGIVWVEFIDKDGKVLYTQKEIGAEPEFGTPPKDQLPLRFVDVNGVDIGDGVIFDGDGQYTLEADMNITEGTGTGDNYDGYGAFGLFNSYADLVISPKTLVTIDSLDLKGTTAKGETKDISIPITDAWKNRSVFDENSDFKCHPINHWGGGDELDSAIPEEVNTITHIKMVFTIVGSELGTYEPPKEVEGEPFNKITYDYTVTNPGTASYIRWDLTANEGYPAYFGVTPISGAGDYTTEVTLAGESRLANLGSYIDASANQNEADAKNVTETKDTEIKLNKITINDTYTFEATDLVLTNKKQYANGLANLWNDQGKALIVTYKNSNDEEVPFTNPDAYLRGSEGMNSNGIKLVKGAPPEVPDEPDNPDDPVGPNPPVDVDPDKTYEAQLSYADSTWAFDNRGSGSNYGGPVKLNGTYTLGIDFTTDTHFVFEGGTLSGANYLYVDLIGLAADIGATTTQKGMDNAQLKELAIKSGLSITDLSILADGEELYKYDDADISFGDIEGKGNMRIDIFNPNNESGDGDTSNYEAPQGVLDLVQGLLQPKENLEVKFTLTYTKPATPDNPNNPNNPSGNNNNNNNKPGNPSNGGSTVKPGAPGNKVTTTAPKSNAKADAKKIVNNAKIKKLSAKAKGKKVTITWKKASKVTGYNIQVATKKNFKKKSIVAKKTLKKNAKKATLKIKKLKKGTTYWVRVQAYKTYKDNGKTKKVTGSWKKFKFKA